MRTRLFHPIVLLALLNALCLQVGTASADGGKIPHLSTDAKNTGPVQLAIGQFPGKYLNGGEFQTMCPTGMVVVGMGAKSGGVVDQIHTLYCKLIALIAIEHEHALPAVAVHVGAGGNGGAYKEYIVPPGSMAIGLLGNDYANIVSHFYLQYAAFDHVHHHHDACPTLGECFNQFGPWGTVDPDKNILSGWTRFQCENGRVMTGIKGHSSDIVNQMQPVCTYVENIDAKGCEVVTGRDALTGPYYPLVAPHIISGQQEWDAIQQAIDQGLCNVSDTEAYVRLLGWFEFALDHPITIQGPAGHRLRMELIGNQHGVAFEPSEAYVAAYLHMSDTEPLPKYAVTLKNGVEWRDPDFYTPLFDYAYHRSTTGFIVRGFMQPSIGLEGNGNLLQHVDIAPKCNAMPNAAVTIQGDNNRVVDSYIGNHCGHGVSIQSGQWNQISRVSFALSTSMGSAAFHTYAAAGRIEPIHREQNFGSVKIAAAPKLSQPGMYQLSLQQLPPAATKLEIFTARKGADPLSFLPTYGDTAGSMPKDLRPRCIEIAEKTMVDIDTAKLNLVPGSALMVTAHAIVLSDDDRKKGRSVCDPELVVDMGVKGNTTMFSTTVVLPYDANANGVLDSACEGVWPEYACVDTDKDGVVDTIDSCPDTANPHQGDDDGDGIGNQCDTTACPAGQIFDAASDQCKDPNCEHGAPKADGTCPEAPPPPKCASPLIEKAGGICCDPDAPADNPISCGYVPTEDHSCADPSKEQWDFTTGQCVPLPGAPATCSAEQDPDPTDPTKCIAKPKSDPTKGSGEDCAKLGKVFDANTQQCVDPVAPAGNGTTNTAVTADTTDVTNGGGTTPASTEEKKEEPKCESGLFLQCGQNAPEKQGWINGCSLVADGDRLRGSTERLEIALMAITLALLLLLRHHRLATPHHA